MTTRCEFYQSHLDEVSRSFAFCIAQLKSPLKEWVGLSYLLLRVLDTIEDSHWASPAEKLKAFAAFDHALSTNSLTPLLPALEAQVPLSELNLYKDFPILIQDFYLLPIAVQSSIRSTALNMSRGMQYFSLKYPHQELRLNSLKEVNQYCFFVAGVIGELLTQLIRNFSENQNLPQKLMTNSIRFGLCLQKINILKDQKEDESQGRHLVPNRNELIQSFTEDAQGAILYLTQIPVHLKEYRLFCAWSLFLGISSLTWIQSHWMQNLATKLPRKMTQILLSKVENIIDDNQKLVHFFQDSIRTLTKTHPAQTALPIKADELAGTWLMQVYSGELKQRELLELGLI